MQCTRSASACFKRCQDISEDLYEAGLGEYVESIFSELIAGKGAVRAALQKTSGRGLDIFLSRNYGYL